MRWVSVSEGWAASESATVLVAGARSGVSEKGGRVAVEIGLESVVALWGVMNIWWEYCKVGVAEAPFNVVGTAS